MSFTISVAHNDARLAASLAFADLGPGPSRVQFFSTEQPAFGGAPGAAPLVEVVLAKPCGAIVDHALVFAQAAAGGDMILVQGVALWARWVNGADAIVADGDVSDETGPGVFKIAGTTGTMLYAGGRCIIGLTAIV